MKTEFNLKGATIQTGLEHGSRRTATVGALTRQLLVKTLWAGKDLLCDLVICKVWKSAMALCNYEWCVKVVNKSNLLSKTPLIVILSRDNMYGCNLKEGYIKQGKAK
jgi:hypothetical protein